MEVRSTDYDVNRAEGYNQEVMQVRKVCTRLWEYEVKINLQRVYGARNILLCLASAWILAGALYTLVVIIIDTKNNVICTVSTNEFPAISTSLYICKHKTAPFLVLPAGTFIASIFFHLVFVFFGIGKSWTLLFPPNKQPISSCNKVLEFIIRVYLYLRFVCCGTQNDFLYRHLTQRWNDVGNFLMFINTFWKNSRPFNSGDLDDFLQFIACSAPQQLGYRLEQEPNTRDVYLIEVFTKLSTDWKVIAKSIQHYLESSNIDFTGKNYSRLLEIAAECTLLECNDDVKNLFNYLYEEKYFELLVSFLNISSEDETSITNYLKFTLKPNLNAVGQPYTEGRSLLFHALRKKFDGTIYRTAAIRILKSRANTEKVYVHWDGLSCTVAAFAKSERLPGFSGDENESTMLDKLEKDLMDLINSASARDVSTQSDSKIKIVKERFGRRVTNSQYNNKSWTDLAEEISCYKFTAWSKEINGFARDIYKAKQWEVLVALMNAFIPEHQDSNYVIGACDLTAADLTAAVCPNLSEQLGLNSLLHYAFSKREYQPFVFTATATILSLTRELPKSVISLGDSPHYFTELGDFVNQYSGLMFQQKQKLLELIRENAHPPLVVL